MRLQTLWIRLTVLTLLLPAGIALAKVNPDWSGELVWPREYSNEAGAKLVMYQPQVTEWEGARKLAARVAIAYSAPAQETPSLGTFEIEAATEVDLETRLVKLSGVEIVRHRFPSADEQTEAKLLAKLVELMPADELIVELDRILASLERAEAQLQPVATKKDPPQIFFSQKPAVLLLFDGKPIWAPIDDSELEFAVNTNWDLFKKGSDHYLRNDDAWLKASDLEGPWSPAGKLPRAFKKLPRDNPNWEDVRSSLPGKKIEASAVPKIFFSQVPAELIQVQGEPRLAIIEDTDLLAVVNTESDLFLYGPESRFYYLVSGRWFRAKKLDGPWQFASHDLPEDFAKIPDDHPMADVKASVPGTPAAREAVLLAQIPQTAKVKRDELTAEATYVGEPEFKEIEGTSMSYAVNTQNDVIQVGDKYYLCLDGVWFVADAAEGPWAVVDSVPDEIYEIPPSSPVYNTTYVRVYDYDPYWVTFGYTAGYYGVYFSYGCMVFGTGWYYNPYYYYGPYYPYPVYYGYPYSYGFGAYYNIYSGTYGRGATVYGPYGGLGGGSRFNPNTGTYARGAAAWGPYNARGWAEAYNPRTGTYARTRQGANVYSSWGTTTVRRGNDWARTARYSDSRGTVAGVRTSRGGQALAVGGAAGRGGVVGQSAAGDLYAGRDGSVYRRGDDGWQRREGGEWKPVDTTRDLSGARDRVGDRTPATGARDRVGGASARDRVGSSGIDRGTLDQLNRDRYGRSRGTTRSAQYGSWRSSGGARPTRGGFGGSGFSGRAGAVRRR